MSNIIEFPKANKPDDAPWDGDIPHIKDAVKICRTIINDGESVCTQTNGFFASMVITELLADLYLSAPKESRSKLMTVINNAIERLDQ